MDRCHLLSWEVIFYIFSISFQVAGAVLLIIKYCGNTMNMMLQEYFPEGGVILVEKNNGQDYIFYAKNDNDVIERIKNENVSKLCAIYISNIVSNELLIKLNKITDILEF